jgi:hypothetical protein
MVFGLKDRSVSTRFAGYVSATKEYLRELPEAFGYWIGALALVGIGMLRGDRRPFYLFGLALFVIYSLGAIHLAASLGYLSGRHGVGWLCRHADHARFALAGGVVGLAAVACLPKTLAPLHPTRIGHRQAGQWLAAQTQPPGSVLDTRGWTAFYSRRPTLRYDAAQVAFGLDDLAYVVVEQRELELDSPRARTLLHLLSAAATQVATFAAPRGRTQDNVLVYRWHPERFAPGLAGGPLIAKTQAEVPRDAASGADDSP